MNATPPGRQPDVRKHLSSSILLWVRTDQPRQTGMDYWKGPHSRIISATPGLHECRQIHMAETNVGRWPATSGIETGIPVDRKIDGVAEVTFQSVVSPLFGRKQTQLAFKDEINVFRRTLLYAGPPNSSRWYQVAGPDARVGARALVYLRRRPGISGGDLRRFLSRTFVPALADTAGLRELRTQTFLRWSQKLWNTPNVAHDNPTEHHLHASLILGFTDAQARAAFFESPEAESLSAALIPVTSAVHAYDVSATITYVENGRVLPCEE